MTIHPASLQGRTARLRKAQKVRDIAENIYYANLILMIGGFAVLVIGTIIYALIATAFGLHVHPYTGVGEALWRIGCGGMGLGMVLYLPALAIRAFGVHYYRKHFNWR